MWENIEVKGCFAYSYFKISQKHLLICHLSGQGVPWTQKHRSTERPIIKYLLGSPSTCVELFCCNDNSNNDFCIYKKNINITSLHSRFPFVYLSTQEYFLWITLFLIVMCLRSSKYSKKRLCCRIKVFLWTALDVGWGETWNALIGSERSLVVAAGQHQCARGALCCAQKTNSQSRGCQTTPIQTTLQSGSRRVWKSAMTCRASGCSASFSVAR